MQDGRFRRAFLELFGRLRRCGNGGEVHVRRRVRRAEQTDVLLADVHDGLRGRVARRRRGLLRCLRRRGLGQDRRVRGGELRDESLLGRFRNDEEGRLEYIDGPTAVWILMMMMMGRNRLKIGINDRQRLSRIERRGRRRFEARECRIFGEVVIRRRQVVARRFPDRGVRGVRNGAGARKARIAGARLPTVGSGGGVLAVLVNGIQAGFGWRVVRRRSGVMLRRARSRSVGQTSESDLSLLLLLLRRRRRRRRRFGFHEASLEQRRHI